MNETKNLIDEESFKSGYLRLPEILKLLGISRSTFYAGIKYGKYPMPLKIGKRVSAWKKEDVRKIIEAQPIK